MSTTLPDISPLHGRTRVVCQVNGRIVTDIPASEISDVLRKERHFVWLDLVDPVDDDMQLLREEFGFHPLALEDTVRGHDRPKVDMYDTYYFLVFATLSYDQGQKRLKSQSMYLFIGRNYLVTVHTGNVRVIDETIERWRRHVGEVGRGGGALVYHLLDAIVDDYFPTIDSLAERVESMEELIFERFQQSALQEVFALKRDLLAVRRIVAPERDVLNVLIRREVPIFDRNTLQYLQDVYDHVIRITDSIDTYRDLLSSALDSFLSIQSNQLNQIVKVLTIASIILMSCALVAGIYGMNFEFMPELHWRLGYPFALALMVLLSGGLIAFFRWKEWL
jgi:magnesium transporter